MPKPVFTSLASQTLSASITRTKEVCAVFKSFYECLNENEGKPLGKRLAEKLHEKLSENGLSFYRTFPGGSKGFETLACVGKVWGQDQFSAHFEYDNRKVTAKMIESQREHWQANLKSLAELEAQREGLGDRERQLVELLAKQDEISAQISALNLPHSVSSAIVEKYEADKRKTRNA